MLRMLVAVDGSETANRAVAHAMHVEQLCSQPLALHLMNVQAPLTFEDVREHVGAEVVNAHYRDEGTKALAAARKLLDDASVDYTWHVAVGPAAETILKYVHEQHCTQIVMGNRGRSAIPGLLLGSVASKVLHLADVPVTLVK
jgi:nucleotide-binding universal stress UspA family protein